MSARRKLLTFAWLAVLWTASCSRSPSYLSFIGQDEPFYRRVAAACEEARTNTSAAVADGRKISSDRLDLPAAIRDLHPDYVRISTNRVFLSVGGGRGGYGVAWERAGGSSWQLTTYAESLERVVFRSQR